MNALPDIWRPAAADHVRMDYHAAQMLRSGRAAELSDEELRRIGARLLATLNGERGLVRSFSPMESERSPATISRLEERDRLIVRFFEKHLLAEKPTEAARTIEKRLRRYQASADWAAERHQNEIPARLNLNAVGQLCWRISKLNGGSAPSFHTIRRILSEHQCRSVLLTDA